MYALECGEVVKGVATKKVRKKKSEKIKTLDNKNLVF